MIRTSPGWNPRFGLAVADVRELPFRKETFDAAYTVHVIGHMGFADRRKAAAEVIRVLGAKGTLVFRSFSKGDFRCGQGYETESGTFRRGTGIITHYSMKRRS